MDQHQLETLKILRSQTKISIAKCKEALLASNYNLAEAIAYIKTHMANVIVTEGRVNKATEEGGIYSATHNHVTSLVVLKTQTDFAAKDSIFIALGEYIAKQIAEHQLHSLEAVNQDPKIQEQIRHTTLQLGEPIVIERIACLTGELIASYIHGRRIGVIVSLEGGDAQLARTIAVQIAANPTIAIKRTDLDHTQCGECNHPKEFYQAHVLMDQPVYKNKELTCEQYLASHQSQVKAFFRFELA